MPRATAQKAGGRYWDALNALALLLILLVILRHPMRTCEDTAALLVAAQMLEEGRTPYVDFVELNPPMSIYVHVVPVVLARVLPFHVIPVFMVLVWLLAAMSSLAVRQLLVRSFGPGLRVHGCVLAFAVTVGSACVYLAQGEWTPFGEREHLFILLFLPYLAMRWVRWEGGEPGWPWAVAAGVAAGVGTCIKPHFVAIALAPELYWIVAKRAWRPLARPEVLLFAGVGVGYAVHFLLLPEAARENLFGRWIPFVARSYWVYDLSLKAVLLRNAVLAIAALGGLGFLADFGREAPCRTLVRPLAAMALAAVAVYAVQRKGFPYHAIPAWFGGVLLLAAIVLCLRPWVLWADESGEAAIRLRLPRALIAWIPPVLALSLCLVVAARLALKGTAPEMTEVARLICRHTEEGDPVLFVSSDLHPAYPTLLQVNRRPGTRFYGQLFQIAMLYAGVTAKGDGRFPYRAGADAPAEETRFLRELAEDVAQFRPRLILVDDSGHSQACPVGFNILEYLTAVGFVAGAMKGYAPLTSVLSEPWGRKFVVFAPEAPRGESLPAIEGGRK